MRTRALALLLIAFLGIVAASLAIEDPTISALVRVGGQESPVQAVGLKAPKREDHYPLVHLRNTSAKQTARILIEAVIAGRGGKVARIQSNSSTNLWPAERAIPPGGDTWAHEAVLESSHLVTGGKGLRSSCLQVTVLVLRVDFADGTSWDRDQNKKGISWTMPTHLDQEDTCKNATATEDQAGQIVGAGFRWSRLDNPAGDEEVDSYSFSCSLVPAKGRDGLTAICPF